jgi:hypothetical protein
MNKKSPAITNRTLKNLTRLGILLFYQFVVNNRTIDLNGAVIHA